MTAPGWLVAAVCFVFVATSGWCFVKAVDRGEWFGAVMQLPVGAIALWCAYTAWVRL